MRTRGGSSEIDMPKRATLRRKNKQVALSASEILPVIKHHVGYPIVYTWVCNTSHSGKTKTYLLAAPHDSYLTVYI